ncbi:MAG: helix-turn-helix domain-containing protein [Gammaproteobacteria bacterium]
MDRDLKTSKSFAEGEARPSVTDLYVGMRLCMRRMILGMEQQDLAAGAGISVHQLQEFEAGLARISASRLYQFSQYLSVPVSWFFDGLGPEAEAAFGGRDATPESILAAVCDKEGFELLRFYYDNISDPLRKRSLVEVARVLAEPNLQLASKEH